MTAYLELCRRCRVRPVMQAHVRFGDALVLMEMPYCRVCKEEMVDKHFEEQEGLANG